MPHTARKPRRIRLMRVAAALAVACAAGCGAPARGPRPTPSAQPRHDPDTVAALLKIASTFNDNYDAGRYGPVYDRWDARSRAIISRADYIRRHTECPSAPATARVEGARRGPDGAWLVSYVIGEAQLTDYWYYAGGRWQFDLPLSNPSSVSLYRMSAAKYVRALGCTH